MESESLEENTPNRSGLAKLPSKTRLRIYR
jgi:hypothetical protein